MPTNIHSNFNIFSDITQILLLTLRGYVYPIHT